jgi:hypothetical protein
MFRRNGHFGKNTSSEQKKDFYEWNFYGDRVPGYPNCCHEHKFSRMDSKHFSDQDLINSIKSGREESVAKFLKVDQLSAMSDKITIAQIMGYFGTKNMILFVLSKLDERNHLKIFHDIFVEILERNRIILLFDILQEEKKYIDIFIKSLFNPSFGVYCDKKRDIEDIAAKISDKESILNVLNGYVDDLSCSEKELVGLFWMINILKGEDGSK